MEKKELLENVNEILADEGYESSESESENKLEELILPALATSRDIQSYLYAYEPPSGKGFVRKIKNTLLSKLRNIIVNVLERLTMRQQKFNELTYQALIELTEENKNLKDQLSKLGSNE